MSDKGDQKDQRFTGAVLMAVGAMVAGLCGLCTWNAMRSQEELSGLAPVFGGAPTFGGAALFVMGLVRVLGHRGG